MDEKQEYEHVFDWILPGLKKEKEVTEKGGEGSGNFGHAGRPGHIGGSSPPGGGVAPADGESGNDKVDALQAAAEESIRQMQGIGLDAVLRKLSTINITGHLAKRSPARRRVDINKLKKDKDLMRMRGDQYRMEERRKVVMGALSRGSMSFEDGAMELSDIDERIKDLTIAILEKEF